MNVSYRGATIDDAARLAAFAVKTFTHTYGAFNTPEDMRDYLASAFGVAHQSRELADTAMVTVLAESGRALVGYAQVRRKERPPCVTENDAAEVYRFYVDAPAHGKGVAQRLMNQCLTTARDLGAKYIWLGVWERNPRAIAFYRKAGFREIGEQYFQLGSDQQRDILMGRPLAAEG